MRKSGFGLAITATLTLALSPLAAHADVARARKSSAASETVKVRLTGLGVESAKADSTVASLTGSEVRFFAQNPDRVQVVGGLHTIEWLGGLMIGAVVLYFYFGHVSNQTGE